MLTRYHRAVSELAQTLMRIFALGLGLDESFFDNKIDRHISRLRIRNYPAQTTKPLPGQLRAGAHSDYGSLTILAAEDRPGGLQVCNAAGDWIDVPVIPGCLIVNIGDLMARWTNDAWVAPNSISATVEEVVYRGFVRHYYLRLPNRERLIAFVQDQSDAPSVQPGAQVRASWGRGRQSRDPGRSPGGAGRGPHGTLGRPPLRKPRASAQPPRFQAAYSRAKHWERAAPGGQSAR